MVQAMYVKIFQKQEKRCIWHPTSRFQKEISQSLKITTDFKAIKNYVTILSVANRSKVHACLTLSRNAEPPTFHRCKGILCTQHQIVTVEITS